MERQLHMEAASQLAYARHAIVLVKMGAYRGEMAKRMRENADFMIASARYKSALARHERARRNLAAA